MLSLSDWREDIRLLQLNNPSYRALFILLSVLKWCLYLGGVILLISFCWLVMSPRSPLFSEPVSSERAFSEPVFSERVFSEPVFSESVSSDPATATPSAIVGGPKESKLIANDFHGEANPSAGTSAGDEQISPERIEYLRSFASRARQQASRQSELSRSTAASVAAPAAIAEGESVAAPQIASENDERKLTVYTVTKPERIEAVTITATDSETGSTVQIESPVTQDDRSDGTTGGMAVNSESNPVAAASLTVGVGAGHSLEGALAAIKSAQEKSDLAGESAVDPETVNTGVALPKTPPNTTVEGDQAYQTGLWVLAQTASHYTVQIGATVNRPFLLRFKEALPADKTIALFRHRMNSSNKQEYVLTYGSFDSYREATAALDSLSQSVRRYGAYVRSFASIQKEVGKLNAVTTRTTDSQPDGSDKQ